MTIIAQFGEGLLVFLIGATCVGLYLVYELIKHRLYLRRTERDKEQAALEFDRVKTHALRRASANNANINIGADRSLQIIQRFPYPAHTKVVETQTQPLQLPPPDYPQVALSTIIEELAFNQLQFTFGTLRETGERLTTTLPKALHIQVTGTTGQGKSVESTSILTQLCVGNDPEHLNLAFLDCEGETTEPFHSQPHVRYLAETPDRAASTLRNLMRELEHRDKVRVVNPNFTAMLIFIEEFLSLKRTMSEHLRNQALEDFTNLAIRGRKRRMFLYTVGQTAYSEKETRDAQAQFQSILTFALKASAARSAGMVGNSEMLKRLMAERREGQFLLQSSISAGDKLVLAPLVNEHMISRLLTSRSVPDHFPGGSQVVPEYDNHNNGNHAGKQAEVDFARVSLMREMIEREASVNEIITAAFPGMRGSSALAEYRKYLAFMVKTVEEA